MLAAILIIICYITTHIASYFYIGIFILSSICSNYGKTSILFRQKNTDCQIPHSVSSIMVDLILFLGKYFLESIFFSASSNVWYDSGKVINEIVLRVDAHLSIVRKWLTLSKSASRCSKNNTSSAPQKNSPKGFTCNTLSFKEALIYT